MPVSNVVQDVIPHLVRAAAAVFICLMPGFAQAAANDSLITLTSVARIRSLSPE